MFKLKNFLTILSNERNFALLQRGREIHHHQLHFVPVRRNRSGQWRLKQTTSTSKQKQYHRQPRQTAIFEFQHRSYLGRSILCDRIAIAGVTDTA